MGGLLILVLCGLYGWFAYKLIVRTHKPVAKTLLILAVVLIPTADAVYGRMKLKQMCEAEGGLKVSRVIENVDGFFEGSQTLDDIWLKKFGFRFIEGKTTAGTFLRKELGQDGATAVLNVDTLQSKFGIGFDNGNADSNFRRVQLYVYELANQERLATFTNITFNGGWVERLVAGMYSSTPNSEGCELTDFGDITLVQSVLKVKKRGIP